MIIPDVNVLVYAHRADTPDHADHRQWLEATVNHPSSFGLPALVCSGFLRIVTHPRIFDPPTTPRVGTTDRDFAALAASSGSIR